MIMIHESEWMNEIGLYARNVLHLVKTHKKKKEKTQKCLMKTQVASPFF
jgi:hypothetical protein